MDEHSITAELERRLGAAEAALRAKADVEADLRQSEELRRIAVEGGRMGTWRWNLRDELIRGDAAFLSLWGYPPSDEPRPLSDFTDRMSPQGRAEMGEMVPRAIASGEEFDGQLAVVNGPTHGRWVRWRGRAERERPWIVNGVSFDVTDQRVQDQRLRESEARHRLMIESWAQAVWETDPCGVVVADSPSWRACTGQTLEEWLGSGWLDAVHPDDRADAGRQWREAIAARGLVDAEFRLRASMGGWCWTNVRAAPVLDADGNVEKWAGMNIDIDARRTAEAALRESGERQAFLLRLSDALRPLADPVAIEGEACRLLSQSLGVNRVYYAQIDEAAGRTRITYDYVQDGPPTLIGDYDLADFPWAVPPYHRGETIVVPDIAHAGIMQEAERAVVISLGMRSMIPVPLLKQGRLLGAIAAADAAPREWRALDVQLVEETCERIWAAVQHARAQDSLRESEARFQQFAKASAAGLWIRKTDTLAMEFVSPAIAAIYGIETDALLGDVERWAGLIVPEDRDTALEHMEAARRGEVAVHDFRIRRPSDGAFRWIRSTDFPLHNNGDVPRIGGIAEDVTETRRLTEHQGVLVAELQHRVRNIMGMIRSIANRTAVGATGIDDYRSLLEGRLLALARVQALLTREANAGGSLRGIIENEVMVQAHRSDQFTLTGPEIRLSPKAVEVLTLAFHELATNALKYGAFSAPDGHLTVGWSSVEKRGAQWLALDWIEEGAPPREPSTRRGFGSELIEARIPYELGGRGRITIGPEGARCRLEFPLGGGESILETDAPQPVTIFGGTLDMTGAPDLTGRTVLVVEDDYFLATDTAAALRGAGAAVLGPCPSLDAMRDLLEDEMPTHAVLDLNLEGGGPQFEIARLLKSRGVPFVFLTGYDSDVIPKDMEDVVRLQKPLPFRAVVEAVAQL